MLAVKKRITLREGEEKVVGFTKKGLRFQAEPLIDGASDLTLDLHGE
ncbi:hypothetical protein VCSRO16_1663 [Vibrio cholerae]|nr:hypothetical protein VCSRO16_1663 [Vibrio cholerae]